MTTPAHTPGPWRIGTPGPNGCYTTGTERGLMVAMVAHSIHMPDQKAQAEGDARLIAAAPELLAALQTLVANGGIGPESMFHDARDAIKKATEG